MERLGERSRNGPIGPAEAIQPIRDRHIYDTDSMHQQIEKRAEKQISSSIYITNFVTTVMVMTGIMMSRMMGKLVKQEPPPSNAQSLVDPPPHQDSPCSQKR